MQTPANNNVIYELISVCNDSRQFFELAAAEIDNTELSLLYSDIAEKRAEIVKNLLKRLRQMGGEQPAAGSELSGEIHAAYIHLRDDVSRNPYSLYFSRLEEPEGKALKALNGGLSTIEDMKLAKELGDYLSTMQQSHNRMRVLRETARYRDPDDGYTTH